MPRNSGPRFRFGALLLIAAVALPALAFEYPLSSTSIRDAYFLGRAGQQRREKFLSQYTRFLPAPATGPQVALVQLETPFVVIVDRSARSIANYYAQDAEKEFTDKPGIFRVRIRIDLTESYGWNMASTPGTIRLRPGDFWKEFKIKLIQGREISLKALHGDPIYTSSDDGGASYLSGAWIVADYDAEEVKDAAATVEVIPPEGEKVDVGFPLDELR